MTPEQKETADPRLNSEWDWPLSSGGDFWTPVQSTLQQKCAEKNHAQHDTDSVLSIATTSAQAKTPTKEPKEEEVVSVHYPKDNRRPARIE